MSETDNNKTDVEQSEDGQTEHATDESQVTADQSDQNEAPDENLSEAEPETSESDSGDVTEPDTNETGSDPDTEVTAEREDDLETDPTTDADAQDNPAVEGNTADEDNAVNQDNGAAEDQVEDDGEAVAREPVDIPNLPQIIEGAILAADKPLSLDHIIQLFPEDEPTRAQVRDAIADIQAHCEGRGFELKEVASGYRFQVRQAYGDWIGRLWDEKPPRYTRALLETLALIAYKQPITRGDIEDIRGVSVSTNIIRTLLEREWIRVVGHRDVPGRPSIYATTKTFLDYFDLTSLDELPTLAEIKDLDKLNEELDLEGDLIEPRTLSLEAVSDEVEATQADDEALDEVTDRVNAIQENIKNLYREPEEDDDFDEDDESFEGTQEADQDSEDAAQPEDLVAAVESDVTEESSADDAHETSEELSDEPAAEADAIETSEPTAEDDESDDEADDDSAENQPPHQS